MTLIAASIAVHEVQKVSVGLERATNAAAMGANLIEWRIDQLADEPDSLNAIKRLVRECPRPCIVTCRPAVGGEGGEYEGDENARLEMFEALAGSDEPPRYIDIELSTFQRDPQRIRALAGRSRGDRQTSFIFSTHDFHGRPADLLQRIETITHETSCAVMKVAWMARSLRDNLEAFDLLRARQKPMIALCMGRFGLMSRVLSGKFGGFLTFASDSVTEVTAPGQPMINELRAPTLYRFDRINSKTKVYGVIGWPVEHSLSPKIHNSGFEAIGFDGVYLPLPIPPEYEHFKATVGAMIDYQSLDFRGASVTIPHKENLLRFVKERGGRCDALCERIGAANTLVVGSAGGLECLNTDCPASVEALCAGMGIVETELKGKRIAVLGAGGVARAVVVGLVDAGANVAVFNRNVERARVMIETILEGGAGARETASDAVHEFRVGEWNQLSRERFDVYVNCTPVGMKGGAHENESPLPPEAPLDGRVTVFDTVYAPERTPLLKEAEARGARTLRGMDMFLRQASLQFETWTGSELSA